MLNFYTLTVLEKIIEPEDTCIIKFKQPVFKKIKYSAGQYITLKVRVGTRVFRRSYSLFSVFGQDTTLNIAVKMIPGGKVSTYLFDQLKVGDAVEVSEPLGRFISSKQKTTSVFWSAGSGVVPCFSVMKDLLFSTSGDVVLYYGVKDENHVILRKGLEALCRQYEDRCRIVYCFSQRVPIDFPCTFHIGRVSGKIIDDAFSSDAEIRHADHFICGPSLMIEDTKESLLSLGIDRLNIHTEEFHVDVKAGELDGVHENAQCSLIIDEKRFDFTVTKGINILEAALDNDVMIEYSCQSGSCTFCKAKLVAGQVKTLTNSDPDTALEPDERLLCCTYPLTSKIEFKI